MNTKKHPMDNYKRFLLNRSTTNTTFVEFVENTIAAEDEEANYCFHKIMVHDWKVGNEILFDTLSEYLTATVIPIDVRTQGDISTFYTSSMILILKIMRLDFMFPYQRNMFNIDVLFNDKSSEDMFHDNIELNNVVSGVVSRRFNDKQELDLSNFSEDQEFKDKKIFFYKLSLLASFKILMLRLGRDTKSLNLSNNKLSQPPLDIMNFFIKGDLTEINLSYNYIKSISDLVRVSSKIEKLWLEGNPLCEENEPSMYVKHITMKFPRLIQLDGLTLNEFGLGFPFNRNFLSDPSKWTKMVVERFLLLYFSRYDCVPRRQNVEKFYDDYGVLSFTTGFTDAEALLVPQYANHSRNILKPGKKQLLHAPKMVYRNKHQFMTMLSQFPKTLHDPSTFTVDVLRHDRFALFLVVDGLFKDLDGPEHQPCVYRFRRTFIFNIYQEKFNTMYHIQHELFHIAYPTPQQLANSFKWPIRNFNKLELINPEPEETEIILTSFCHVSLLKREEAEIRLKRNNWDLKKALQEVISHATKDEISRDRFIDYDDFPDTSALHDDVEMVD